jgi:general secretion pathway protein M
MGAKMKQEIGKRWQAFSARLAPRERLALQSAAWLLGGLLVWSVAIAPAWRVLQSAPERQARLLPQAHAMRAMAAEARALRASEAPQPQDWSERLRALEASSARLLQDQARLSPAGEQVSVTLRDVSPTALAQWLQEVRTGARLRPIRTQLQRAGTPAATHWSGTLVLAASPESGS